MGGVSGTAHNPNSRKAYSWIMNHSTRDSGFFFLLLVRAYPWSTIIIDSVSPTRPDIILAMCAVTYWTFWCQKLHRDTKYCYSLWGQYPWSIIPMDIETHSNHSILGSHVRRYPKVTLMHDVASGFQMLAPCARGSPGHLLWLTLRVTSNISPMLC